MADEQEILSYIIKGQNEVAGMLQQHAQLLSSIAESAKKMAAETENAGKKTKQAADDSQSFVDKLKEIASNTDKTGSILNTFQGKISGLWQNPTQGVNELSSALSGLASGPAAAAVTAVGAIATEAVAVTIELAKLTQQAVDLGASLTDLSNKTQINVPELSRLRVAVEAAGGSIEQTSNTIFMMNRRFADSAPLVEKGLNRLGMTIDQFAGTSGAEKFMMLSDAFRSMGSEVDKDAAIFEIMGRRGGDALALLEQPLRQLAGQSEELGQVWSGPQAQAAKDLQIQTNLLKLQLEGMGLSIGRTLIPVAETMITDFRVWLSVTKDLVKEVSGLNNTTAFLGMIDAALHGPGKAPEAPAAPNLAAGGPPTQAGAGTDTDALTHTKSITDALMANYALIHKAALQAQKDAQNYAAAWAALGATEQSVSETERQLIIYYVDRGKKISDIATALGIEAAAVQSVANTEKLRQELNKKANEEIVRNMQHEVEEYDKATKHYVDAYVKAYEQVVTAGRNTSAQITQLHLDGEMRQTQATEDAMQKEIDSYAGLREYVPKLYDELVGQIKEKYALIIAEATGANKTVQQQLYDLGFRTNDELAGNALNAKNTFKAVSDDGTISAQQILKAWQDYYNAEHQDQIAQQQRYDATMQRYVGLFTQMSQIGGAAFSSITKGIATMFTVAQTSSDAFAQINAGLEAMNSGSEDVAKQGLQDVATGVLSIVAATGQAIAAFSQLSQTASTTSRVMQGALAGAQTGLAVSGGNPYGAAVGGLIGGLIGLFSKPEFKKVIDDISAATGVQISDGLAKAIAASESQYKISRSVAEALNIDKLMDEIGISAKNVAMYVQPINILMAEIAKGGKDATAASNELDTALGKIFATVPDGELLNNQLLTMVGNLRDAGSESKALQDFLGKAVDQVTSGANAITAGFAAPLLKQFTDLSDLTEKTIPGLVEKREQLMQSLAGTKTTSPDFAKLTEQLQGVEQQLQQAFQDANKFAGALTDAANGGEEDFDRLGRLVTTSFAAQVAAGKNFVTVLNNLGPSLDQLGQLQETLGFKGTDSINKLLGLRQIVSTNKELADSIGGLNDLMTGLSNLGAVNQQTFTDFGDEASAQFDRLTKAGATGDQSLALMQPTLQKLFELQEQYGFAVDESTQKLLDSAKADGIVGESHKNVQQQMVDVLNKILGSFDALLDHWGVKLPAAAIAGSTTAANSLGGAKKSVDDLGGAVDRAAGKYKDLGRAAQDATSTAYDGQTGVIYGNSPGGLVDIIAHLQSLQDEYKNFAVTASAATQQVIGHTKEYNQSLLDAQQALQLSLTVDPTQNALLSLQFQYENQVRQAQQQFGGEPGGIADLLNTLQASYEAQRLKIVNDAETKVEQTQADAMKAQAKELQSLQNALTSARLDAMDDGIDKTLAKLQEQYTEELTALQDQFAGQADFLAQATSVLYATYQQNVANAIKANADKTTAEAAAAAKQLQDAFTKSYQSLQDELQDTIVSQMADSTNKQIEQLEIQKDRRLRALQDQFGAESDMYKQQAALLDQIYGLQERQLTNAGADASIATLQKAYYSVLNSPIVFGQETARQNDLTRIASQLRQVQAGYADAMSAVGGFNIPALPTTVPSQSGGIETAQTQDRLVAYGGQQDTLNGNVSISIQLTDANGNVLTSTDFQSIEEAISAGKIKLVARNTTQRAG